MASIGISTEEAAAVKDSGGFVPVYVPAESLAEFYELAAERLRLRLGNQAVVKEGVASVPTTSAVQAAISAPIQPYRRGRAADASWPDDLLRRCYFESPPTMVSLFDLMAQRDGEKETQCD